MTNTTQAPPRGPRVKQAARRSAEEWTIEVGDWKRSGKGSLEYAKERGISAASLKWWSNEFRRRGRLDSAGPAFLPVRVGGGDDVTSATKTTGVRAEVVLAGGRCVRVAGELTLEQFARLLDVVEGGQSC